MAARAAQNIQDSLIARLPLVVPRAPSPSPSVFSDASGDEATDTLAIAFHQTFIDNPTSHGLLIRRTSAGGVSCRANARALDVDQDEENVLVLPRVHLDPDDFRYEQELQAQVVGEHEAAQDDQQLERERGRTKARWLGAAVVLLVLVVLAKFAPTTGSVYLSVPWSSSHPSQVKRPPLDTTAGEDSISLSNRGPAVGVDVARKAVDGVASLVGVFRDHLIQPYALHLDIYGTHTYGRHRAAGNRTILEQLYRSLIEICDYATCKLCFGIAVEGESWVSAEVRYSPFSSFFSLFFFFLFFFFFPFCHTLSRPITNPFASLVQVQPACQFANDVLWNASEEYRAVYRYLTGYSRGYELPYHSDPLFSRDFVLALASLAHDMRRLASDASLADGDRKPVGRRFADVVGWYLIPGNPDFFEQRDRAEQMVGEPSGELARVFHQLRRKLSEVERVNEVTEVVRRTLLLAAMARHELVKGILGGRRRFWKPGKEPVELEVYLQLGQQAVDLTWRALPMAEAVGAHAGSLVRVIDDALATADETMAWLRGAAREEEEGRMPVAPDLDYAANQFEKLARELHKCVEAGMDEGLRSEFEGDFELELA